MLPRAPSPDPGAAPGPDPARVWRDAVAPLLLYAVAFLVLTWPAAASFGTAFFCDEGDGLQNVWNLWWTRKAVLELHRLPWWTSFLHHPWGTTLLGHTLNAFNGLLGIPLSALLTPVQVHNVIVVFSFAVGGWGAFLLAREEGVSWPAGLVAGLAFTFTGYHFAHAEGHLQLVSLEWLPFFALAWLRLVRAPSHRRALIAAGALGLVVLCDYYYFAYCVLLGVLVAGWELLRRRDPGLLWRRPHLRPVLTFLVASACTSGVLVGALLHRSAVDPFVVGAHDPAEFSTDLLAPFVPGGHSAWHGLTSWYWGGLRGNIHESSVYLGLTVLALAVAGAARRRTSTGRLWLGVAVVFFVLSLGPALQWRGAEVSGAWMPYRWLETAIPALRLSGCPVRMMVVVALAVSQLAGYGFARLVSGGALRRLSGALVACALLVDLRPRALTLSRPVVPGWALVLRARPGTGGLLDLSGTSEPMALYLQTLHEKPIAFGYVSREARSVVRNRLVISRLVEERRLDVLRDGYGFRYLVTDGTEPRQRGMLFESERARLYDLAEMF